MMSSNLKLLRGLVKELRHRTRTGTAIDSPLIHFVFNQFRKFQVTSELVCRQAKEAQSTGEAYFVYLESSRKHAELLKHYHGRGERSVEDTAKLVGFKLPHDSD
ncbi:unnamed protein product [Notodromas monacha]|uniref:Protein FMC1 homolog n=1 Tax=Notodromas monacha TaxID=399045 RepID=A0A7R9GER0_9CRUS|nr:unnamed protein product [Notodromas monacha]CAG0918321.1 unnamed protein product [Notodromas monacha]